MAASDKLNKTLFHGTAGDLEGGIVQPSSWGEYGPGAYATSDLNMARNYAAIAAKKAGNKGLGVVHQVEPMSEAVPMRAHGVFRDRSGFKSVGVVPHPKPSKKKAK